MSNIFTNCVVCLHNVILCLNSTFKNMKEETNLGPGQIVSKYSRGRLVIIFTKVNMCRQQKILCNMQTVIHLFHWINWKDV